MQPAGSTPDLSILQPEPQDELFHITRRRHSYSWGYSFPKVWRTLNVEGLPLASHKEPAVIGTRRGPQ